MKTEIIATIGPASIDKNILEEMISAGMNIIRINSAYGDFDQYKNILNNLSLADINNKVRVLFDIKGTDKIWFCKENKMDFIAISFTESKDQVEGIKSDFPNIKIISKIESLKGVENYNEILESSDGVMVARGDLGEAVSIEKVPPLQKKFTKLAIQKGKYVIAATEMLLSMTNNPYPTNAEVSDVANAVFDRVDAIMLSEETAIGRFPVMAVDMMRKIANEAEGYR